VDETVVDITNFRATRAPAPPRKGPCTITFLSSAFGGPNGFMTLAYNFTAPDGDWRAILDQVRDQGGVWVDLPEEPGASYLLPWPCAAVRIVQGAG
jgi:hypothetical protein